MSRRTEVQVGVTVVVAIVILVWGMAWLKEFSLHQSKRIWRISFQQTGGLSTSDEVLVNGIRKGQVRSLKLEGDRVIVALELDKSIELTSDSDVAIRNVGLMGERVVAVDLRNSGKPLDPSQTIEGTYEQGMGEVMGQLGGAIEAITGLSDDLRTIVKEMGGGGRLERTVENFSATSEELRKLIADNRSSLTTAISNFADASKTAKSLTTDRQAELDTAIQNFASAAERMNRLSGRLDSLRTVIQAMTTRVEQGQGTLGKLVNDDHLYDDLNQSVKSLNTLIDDVKKHPKKYLKFSIF